jgi:DNA-binding LacI/PurR family transcriptional regulator
MLPRPTAIFAGNDMIALGVFHAIREPGLSCPSDVSVIGFDAPEFTGPSLSLCLPAGYQLGATVASMLLDRVKGAEGPPIHGSLQTQLKVRESAAHRRASKNNPA